MHSDTLPPADIHWLADHFGQLWQQFYDQLESVDSDLISNSSAEQLQDAMEQLIDTLISQEDDFASSIPLQDQASETVELGDLTDYGLSILENLFQISQELELELDLHQWERLSVSLALWGVHHGADISVYTVLVNGLANIANQISDPNQMKLLYNTMSEMLDAATMGTVDEALYNDHEHPWRILLFNRAIVAARSHEPRFIEEAFSAIEEHLPEQAVDFFSEGLAHLENEEFPPETKEMVAKFYRRCKKPIFH